MKRLALIAAVVLVAAGSARAATFAIVRSDAETPNFPGSLVLPPAWTEHANGWRQLGVGELQALWESAGAAYGIPWQVLAAINKIESNLGRNMGPSSAGAVGWMQFMPETWLRWGLDASGDGLADPWDPEDAVFAAARYLAAAGGGADLERAVFAYNHADWYVRDVLSLADVIAGGGGGLLFDLDGLRQRSAEAELEVAQTNEELLLLTAREERLLGRARRARLLSRALELRRQAVQVGVRVAELRARLAAAELELAAARESSLAASFSPAISSLLAAPSFSAGYVFPVGGGPATVSVGHDHHDYAAADIAAPTGAPVWAHTDLVVVRGWAEPEGRCGIGATFQAADGRGWTYCHLSYLDPAVQTGAVLAAGAPVGLVGSTGTRSSGPHLHLQLVGTAGYPQDEAWFRSFAGLGFRWQDAERAPLVFAVLPQAGDTLFFTFHG